MVRIYESSDRPALLRLWNSLGVNMGYAPMTESALQKLIWDQPQFDPALTFVLEKDGKLRGFAFGCVQEKRGHLGCLLAETVADAAMLASKMEERFRARGCDHSMVSFWCPIRLPWVMPGTNGHQHNNLPGVPVDLPLHGWLLELGYVPQSRETAMHLDLKDFEIPARVEEKAARMETEGYTVSQYAPQRHWGLKQMVDSLGNPIWSREIPEAGEKGQRLLVALKGDQVAGFAGPVYPEETGRGYFSGIGVAPEFEGKGFGTLLFYRLCREERQAGAAYMSLFTGEENPARKIYERAGFEVRRTFDVMKKLL